MKFLILVGGLLVVALVAVGVWFLLENITIRKGKRK